MKRFASLVLSVFLLLSTFPMTASATAVTITIPDSDTLSATYSSAELAELWSQIKAMLMVNGAYPFSDLEKGDTGYEVLALQTQLAALGYYTKTIVDNFGSGTYSAMLTFEDVNDLNENGIASVSDQQLLYSLVSSEIESTDAGLALGLDAYEAEDLLALWYEIGDLMRASGDYPFTALERDNVGYEVTVLQTRLAELGYYQLEIDGIFGNGTYNALRSFEKASGLSVNGIASSADQQALFSSDAVYASQQSTTTTKTTTTQTTTNRNTTPDSVSGATSDNP